MSDRCGFCNTKTETDMLVLGNQWLEFCAPCGDTEVLTNSHTGEVATISAVFDSIGDGTAVATIPAPPAPEPVLVDGCFLNGQPITRNYEE